MLLLLLRHFNRSILQPSFILSKLKEIDKSELDVQISLFFKDIQSTFGIHVFCKRRSQLNSDHMYLKKNQQKKKFGGGWGYADHEGKSAQMKPPTISQALNQCSFVKQCSLRVSLFEQRLSRVSFSSLLFFKPFVVFFLRNFEGKLLLILFGIYRRNTKMSIKFQ